MKIKLIFAFTLVLLFKTGWTEAQTLLWEVSGNKLKQPSYLFGTYHLLKDEYLQQFPEVGEKLEEAQSIMVEIDADSAQMVQATMGAAIMQGNSLDKLLDSASYGRVGKELMSSMGYPIQAFNMFKPAFLTMSFTMLYSMQANPVLEQYNGKLMDQYITDKGKTAGKQVIALETAAEQLDMLFNHYTLEEQAQQLADFVNEKEEMLKGQKDLADAYMEYNFEKMVRLSEALSQNYGDLAYLTDDRNKRWIPAIEKSINENATFIAVGALHLPGKNGLIELLRKEGYTVKPVMK
jgi:uncharacterized protein YbaP (TraB family)